MSGIVVIHDTAGVPVSVAELERMLCVIRHRRHDGMGTWCGTDGVGLGHVRLAVIDLSRDSDQPFVMGDDDLVLTYNVEIFNYVELRAELEGLGHRFRTSSDTEVLLAAYRQWGRAVCSHLNGMWAFAIYDAGRRELFCSRDRFGIKPLYYATVAGRLLLASEPKALLAAAPELAQLEPSAVSKLMRASLASHVPEHFCRGVRRFPQAHNMVAKLGRAPVFSRYWDYPSAIDRTITFEEACEQFRALLIDAVRLCMRSDVPVGTTLSSGVDSSSIVCLLRTFHSGEHQAFTAEFPGSEADESVAARELARELGMAHFAMYPPPATSCLFWSRSSTTWTVRPNTRRRCRYWHIMRSPCGSGSASASKARRRRRVARRVLSDSRALGGCRCRSGGALAASGPRHFRYGRLCPPG